MSGDARDFNNMETGAVIKFFFFFFLQGKAPKDTHGILTETIGEHAPSNSTVKNWVAQFTRGDLFFSPVMHLVLGDTKQWPPRRLLIKFTS